MTTPPPDPTNPDLLLGIRAYLTTQGLVRDPRVAGAAPPLWITPTHGTPAPGEAVGLSANEVGIPRFVLIAPIGTDTDMSAGKALRTSTTKGLSWTIVPAPAVRAAPMSRV